MKNLISLSVGFIFAMGLGISGMTQVHVVRGFLDVLGEWNPALLGVMVGAIGVHSVFFFLIKNKPGPLLDSKFHLPTKKDIDGRLLTGAALFGIGWGWTGICPGPGLVASMSGDIHIVMFVLSMLVGMKVFKLVEHRLR